jgi:hypothetical protein
MLALILAAASLLSSPDELHVLNGTVEKVNYKGREAVKLIIAKGKEQSDEDMMAIVPGTDFEDGTLEVDVSGAPRPGSGPTAKGFVGLAFRVQNDGEASELFYIRPANGRMQDQAMRNHSTQYVSSPGYGWKKLREENPWVYESYADLEPGKWTHLRIVVAGDKAQLYVNGAKQPTLIVNDLKRGKSRGAVALWSHCTTDAYFSGLKISPARPPPG